MGSEEQEASEEAWSVGERLEEGRTRLHHTRYIQISSVSAMNDIYIEREDGWMDRLMHYSHHHDLIYSLSTPALSTCCTCYM